MEKNLLEKYAELNNEVKNAIREMVAKLHLLTNEGTAISISLDQSMGAVQDNLIETVDDNMETVLCCITQVTCEDNYIFVDGINDYQKTYHCVAVSSNILQAVYSCLYNYIEEYMTAEIRTCCCDDAGLTEFKDYAPISNDTFTYDGVDYYMEKFTHPITNKSVYRIARFIGWVDEKEMKRIY